MVGLPKRRFTPFSDDREPPVSGHLSREERLSQESVELDRTLGRPSNEDRGSAFDRSTNPLPPGATASGPRTYVIDGGLMLPEGQYLIEVYPDGGVTLAWRGDSDHSTMWLPPVSGVRS